MVTIYRFSFYLAITILSEPWKTVVDKRNDVSFRREKLGVHTSKFVYAKHQSLPAMLHADSDHRGYDHRDVVPLSVHKLVDP